MRHSCSMFDIEKFRFNIRIDYSSTEKIVLSHSLLTASGGLTTASNVVALFAWCGFNAIDSFFFTRTKLFPPQRQRLVLTTKTKAKKLCPS